MNSFTNPLLRELRWLHPGAHPHTLACLLMAEYGVEMDGRRVRAMLKDAGGSAGGKRPPD